MAANSNSLLKAVCQGRLRLTRLLLEGGAYINESNEHGETPLIIACKSKNTDNQGVPKAKMIGYLLESGADPNIQDKSGKTALMHACLAQAGPEVVSLLLHSGADPCLEDHTGLSTLIHAINCNDEITLKLVMDSFKVRGKEVIIIITERLACGRLMAKQYLKVPPMTEGEHCDRRHSSMSCASPSEIHLSTSPQETLSSSPTEKTFCLNDIHKMTSSQKSSSLSPLRHRRVNKVHHLQRLHSEPWLKIPQSILDKHQAKNNWPMNELPDITPEEQNDTPTFDFPLLYSCSADLKEATCLIQSQLQENNTSDSKVLKPDGVLSRNMFAEGLSSIHSLSHPNLNSKESTEFTKPESGPEKTLHDLAVPSLCKILHRRKPGLDYYGSDSQLSVSDNYLGKCKRQDDKTELVSSLSSTLGSSTEHFETVQKTHLLNPEINVSEVYHTDSPFNHRPSLLPPLIYQSPVPSASSNKPTCGLLSVIKQHRPSVPPGLPKELKTRKILMRRHSMQTEQMKQLW